MIDTLYRPGQLDSGRQPGCKSLRCLVVENDPQVNEHLQEALKRVLPGADILPAARDGHEALRRIREVAPDLLLLDLDLPGMDGLTMLRALGGHRPLTTIAVASESLEGGRAVWEALALGADDFITKRAVRRGGGQTQVCDRIDERLQGVLEPLIGCRQERDIDSSATPASEQQIEELAVLVFLLQTRHLRRVASLLSRHGASLRVPLVLQADHPPRYTRAIHEGLDRLAKLPVRIAVSGEKLVPGQSVLVPGGCRGDLRLVAGELRLQLQMMPPRTSSAQRRAMMLRSYVGFGGAPVGVVLADPPPDAALQWVEGVAAERRLFYLPQAPGESSEARLFPAQTLSAHPLLTVLS